MCNIALAFMSIPVMTFSMTKAGDYIDRNVGAVNRRVAYEDQADQGKSLDLSRAPPEQVRERGFTSIR